MSFYRVQPIDLLRNVAGVVSIALGWAGGPLGFRRGFFVAIPIADGINLMVDLYLLRDGKLRKGGRKTSAEPCLNPRLM